MIDAKIAKKLILSGIAELTSANGFTARTKDQAFDLSKSFGGFVIHIGFIPHGRADLDVTVDIAVRVNAVEALVNGARTDLSASESQKTATLGGDIGNIREGRQRRWTITSLDELSEVTPRIYAEMLAVAWPFFGRYSNIRNVLAVLSSSNPRDWQLAPGHVARCRRAIALAFIIGSADEIEAVTNSCETLLAEKDQTALPELREFTASLRAKRDQRQLPNLS